MNFRGGRNPHTRVFFNLASAEQPIPRLGKISLEMSFEDLAACGRCMEFSSGRRDRLGDRGRLADLQFTLLGAVRWWRKNEFNHR